LPRHGSDGGRKVLMVDGSTKHTENETPDKVDYMGVVEQRITRIMRAPLEELIDPAHQVCADLGVIAQWGLREADSGALVGGGPVYFSTPGGSHCSVVESVRVSSRSNSEAP
jgi:hypothetical protein